MDDDLGCNGLACPKLVRTKKILIASDFIMIVLQSEMKMSD